MGGGCLRRRGYEPYKKTLMFVQQSALSPADPGRCHEDNSRLLNRGPLKMHARSRLCIFNEVCLKYLIASCSFGKQIRLFSLIFDAEMNKCKTYTLISPFLSIVSVCCRLDVSARLASHRLHWSASFCGLLFKERDLASMKTEMISFRSVLSPV